MLTTRYIPRAVFILLFPLLLFPSAKNFAQDNTSNSWENRIFTLDELKKYDGKDGRPAYVAVDGIVYDVSASPHWKNGQHKGIHHAGADLTADFKSKAPGKIHIEGEVLERMPKVGILKDKDMRQQIETSTPPAAKSTLHYHHHATTAATHKEPEEEVSDYNVNPSFYGRTVSCPVTGEKFKISSKTPSVKYKNKVYFFCCPACAEDFKKNPSEYALPTGKPAKKR